MLIAQQSPETVQTALKCDKRQRVPLGQVQLKNLFAVLTDILEHKIGKVISQELRIFVY